MGVLVCAGCAAFSSDSDVQRATQGPTADEIYMTRFVRGYARLPTFDEKQAWRADLDNRVSDYFVKRPDVGTSALATQFRFYRRVQVGMSREEVTLLLGPAEATTTDAKLMETAAKKFWPQVKEHAREMWIYPGAWQLYFDGDRLVDLTVAGKPPLE